MSRDAKLLAGRNLVAPARGITPIRKLTMDDSTDEMAQIAEAATQFQRQTTGHAPTAVTVVLSDDTLVITLHDALSPAEKVLATRPDGAAQVQEFHRQLFANASSSLQQRINLITGRKVREAAVEVEPTTGAVVHAFTSGTMVQVFLLAKNTSERTEVNCESGSLS